MTLDHARHAAASSLLATTSMAALLLAAPPAHAGQTITTPQAAITNAGTTGFIVINGTTIAGAIANTGKITPGKTVTVGGNSVTAALALINGASVGGGIVNGGTISANTMNAFATSIRIAKGSGVAGGITNDGALSADATKGVALGIFVGANSTVANGVTNSHSGTITATGGSFATGIEMSGGTIGGGIANNGAITARATNGIVRGIALFTHSTVTGGITNGGTITATGISFATGIEIFGSTVSGGIANNGAITANAMSGVAKGIGLFTHSTLTGGITNRSAISATGVSFASGIEILGSTVSGGIANNGTISANANSVANAITVALNSTVTGGISNSGTITATGGKAGRGIFVDNYGTTVVGGITNTGTISGSTASIEVLGTGSPTTINQRGGALIGSVLGSGNGNADVLNFSGGHIVLSPTQSVSGVGTFNQTGGTLVLGLLESNFASVNAGSVTLGGTLQLAPSGNLVELAANRTTFEDIIVSGTPITGHFVAVGSSVGLLGVTLTQDATTPNALDATVSLSQSGLAASAQTLTQTLRLGLDAPLVLTQTVRDRLVAGAAYDGGGIATASLAGAAHQIAGGAGILSDGATTDRGGATDREGVWARGFGSIGQADALGASPAYQTDRLGLLAGVDWRALPELVLGVAGGYTDSEASFSEGSRLSVNSYDGLLYAGWSPGALYVTGSAGGGINDDRTTRQLAPEGLAGAATASPQGLSYSAYAETGYRLPRGSYTLAPYLALSYVHSHVEGFSEAGGFGTLKLAAADSNSLQSILGFRAAATFGPFTPEFRLGWAHEYLDAAQTIEASLATVPGSTFSATGPNFGRDSALIGLGLTHNITSAVDLFVDYDGRLTGSLQEHAVSAGVRVAF